MRNREERKSTLRPAEVDEQPQSPPPPLVKRASLQAEYRGGEAQPPAEWRPWERHFLVLSGSHRRTRTRADDAGRARCGMYAGCHFAAEPPSVKLGAASGHETFSKLYAFSTADALSRWALPRVMIDGTSRPASKTVENEVRQDCLIKG